MYYIADDKSILQSTSMLKISKQINKTLYILTNWLTANKLSLIKIGKSSTDILNLSESAFNFWKKSDLVQIIVDLEGKVIVDAGVHKLY